MLTFKLLPAWLIPGRRYTFLYSFIPPSFHIPREIAGKRGWLIERGNSQNSEMIKPASIYLLASYTEAPRDIMVSAAKLLLIFLLFFEAGGKERFTCRVSEVKSRTRAVVR